MVAAFKRTRAAFASPDLRLALVGAEVLPGVDVQTDEQIAAYLRGATLSMSHVFASNKMGKESDPLAVVDKNGKVYGVKNCKQLVPVSSCLAYVGN